MSQLSKQWTRVNRADSDGGVAWYLKDKPRRWNWALLQRNASYTEWEVRIWGGGDWEWVTNVKTLRAAKAVGRLLASARIATANF